MNNLYLCYFASPDLKSSVNRFFKQAKDTNFYQEIKIFSWKDLTINKKKQIESFFKKKIKDCTDMRVGNQKSY